MRYEYKMVLQGSFGQGRLSIEEELNVLGRDRWELCTIDWGCLIFKRELLR